MRSSSRRRTPAGGRDWSRTQTPPFRVETCAPLVLRVGRPVGHLDADAAPAYYCKR